MNESYDITRVGSAATEHVASARGSRLPCGAARWMRGDPASAGYPGATPMPREWSIG